MENTENHYDLIVIGSGMGSLTTASLMASVGKKRVLVLESGPKLGGFLHKFRRKKYTWDPGVHYVSSMNEGELGRHLMDLVTGGKAHWHKMGEQLENISFPQEEFSISSDLSQYRRDLIARFPAEEKNIDRYFKDMKSLSGWTSRWFISKQFPDWLASLVSSGRKLARRNTKEYFEELFDDKLLIGILTAQWPDYGTPPSDSILGFHATVITAYFSGGYYPIGGPDSMIVGAIDQIEKQQGKCLRRHEVEEILIKDNQAYGVRVKHKKTTKEFFAPKIVSGAGVVNTFEKMVASDYAKKEREKAGKAIPGTSALNLFLGLKDDPAKLGFKDCNYWMYDDIDHDNIQAPSEDLPDIEGAFLSFGSMRDPESTSHTAQIVSFSNITDWSEFEGTQWKRRGVEYEDQKEAMTEKLLCFIDKYKPGLRDLIDHQELSTPLTVKSFLSHPHGQIYGRACTLERLDNEFNVGTSVKNLYLTGTDLAVPGIDSALMVGVMTASKLLGVAGMPRIMLQAYTTKYESPLEINSVTVNKADAYVR